MPRGNEEEPGLTTAGTTDGAVDLYWIPLGAATPCVRFNGVVYEAVAAALERRPRCQLYHSVLAITLPWGRYMVEMTPVPDNHGHQRGVVAEGPVGLRSAGSLRLFRYEVRRWRDGIVPDLAYAVDSPVAVTRDPQLARAIFEQLPLVPTPTWGRDELGAGEMWSCNSITSWVLCSAGVEVEALRLPANARAPGWDAGIRMARRRVQPDPAERRSAGRRATSSCPHHSRTVHVGAGHG